MALVLGCLLVEVPITASMSQVPFDFLQPGMALPDNIRSLFGGAPGAVPRGTGSGFSGAEATQTHAQAGTRAGGWAEGMGSNANAVNGLAGTALSVNIPDETLRPI